MNNAVQILGRHKNGNFFITKDVQKVAQALADGDGYRYFDFAGGDDGRKVTLKEITPEAEVEAPPDDFEIRTVNVAGQSVRVSTLTEKAKRDKKKAEDAETLRISEENRERKDIEASEDAANHDAEKKAARIRRAAKMAEDEKAAEDEAATENAELHGTDDGA